MKDVKINMEEVLSYIDPADLNYQEWVNVGMGLKEDGYTCDIWDKWSKRDAGRYHQGECWKKWATFTGSATPITGATVVQMAKDRGWAGRRHESRELAWDDILDTDDDVIVREGWIEREEIQEPDRWVPTEQLVTYLETLFDPDEKVNYVTTATFRKDNNGREKWFPANKGNSDRTAAELIRSLKKHSGDIGATIGDTKPEAGAWIRFNPMDGEGVKNDNVTDFRYALVESDDIDVEKQNAIMRELELPIAVMVYSGGKSLHAIVHIDAGDDKTEYYKRVEYLYSVCQKNGLIVDTQDKNPSRLSRMPGIMRGEKKQFIVATNIGKSSWSEWREWIEGVNDDLPDIVSMDDIWDNMPPLAEPLIEGVLRKGHKMLLAGPSKAGKSYALMQLCVAIATGGKWFGFQCAKGSVLYVDLELDKASCYNRFGSIRKALKLRGEDVKGIEVWNLRGHACTMDKLAPKLIRRILKRNKNAEEKLSAVIIDPIYKVLTGDENNASDMGKFCNLFDKVATETETSVIYCHHHSKGAQGHKQAMDRSSGSGVFARDPDAVLDMIELVNVDQMTAHGRSAWRIEGALREFRAFDPVNVWYDNPIHIVDEEGILDEAKPESATPPWQKGADATKAKAESQKAARDSKLMEAYEAIAQENDGVVTTRQMLTEMGVGTMQTIRRYIAESPFLTYDQTGRVTCTYGDGWECDDDSPTNNG